MVVVTYAPDFQGNLEENLLTTVWLSVLVLVIAVIMTVTVLHCVTRPLSSTVGFMKELQGLLAQQTKLSKQVNAYGGLGSSAKRSRKNSNPAGTVDAVRANAKAALQRSASATSG